MKRHRDFLPMTHFLSFMYIHYVGHFLSQCLSLTFHQGVTLFFFELGSNNVKTLCLV